MVEYFAAIFGLGDYFHVVYIFQDGDDTISEYPVIVGYHYSYHVGRVGKIAG